MPPRRKSLRVPSDGLELAVEVLGDGQPLLFAHPLGSCHHQTERVLAPLTEDYQLIVFDQRGHCGSTPVTDEALYDARRMAADIGAILDHLGLEQAIVGGESMGAATALLFATMHPKRVQQLIQVAPTSVDRANPNAAMIVAISDFAERYGLQAAADAITLSSMSHGIPREAASMVTALWSHHHVESFAAANRVVPMWAPFEDLNPVAALRMPIGVFAWGADPSRPLPLARRLAAAARRGRIETVASLAEIASDPLVYASSIRKLLSP
ncbi:MAG TPA: alpha/beta hydrolase [Candidatus Binatia bacterium]|nr:alpha/beta hydrolase [Candidatus Binatia bacterium]